VARRPVAGAPRAGSGLHGSDDPLLRPAAARAAARAIGDACLAILPEGGHCLPAAVYPQVASEVRALADQAASAPSQAAS